MTTDEDTIALAWRRSKSRSARARRPTQKETVFDVRDLSVFYGTTTAISGVNLEIYRNMVTALIGPSGCGKSTFIRCLNRMNDLVPGARIEGEVLYHGQDIYGSGVDPVEVRRWIGMVFQKPNPFPKSIYDNVAWGPRTLGMQQGSRRARRARADAGRAVGRGEGPAEEERARALGRPAAAPLHRARARRRARSDPARRAGVGARPDRDVEHRGPLHELKRDYTIVIVTHNMQQAARVADLTAFFSLEVHEDGRGTESSSSTTRRRRSSRSRPTRGPRTTSPDDSDEDLSRMSSTRTEATLQEEGELVLRALRGAMNALWEQDTELADEVIAFDDEIDEMLPQHPGGNPGPARAADAGRGRPAARARAAPLEPPPRAHGRLLRDDREADEARLEFEPEPALVDAFADMGTRAEGMIRVALDSFARPRPRAGRARSSSSTS